MNGKRTQGTRNGTSQNTGNGFAFISGVFGANSVPHVAAGAREERMLTPLGGQDSGPGLNLVWGSMNLLASAATAFLALRRTDKAKRLFLPFAGGVAAYAVWSVIYDRFADVG